MKSSLRGMGLGVVALLGLGLMGCSAPTGDGPEVAVHDAWVRMPAPSRTDTAAYMVIENMGDAARSLVSVSSPDVEKIEMHEMKMMDSAGAEQAGGPMMAMMPVAKIDIPAKGRATLEPNGFHLMLFGVKSALAEGSSVNLTLTLDDGSTVEAAASVLARDNHNHDHDHGSH